MKLERRGGRQGGKGMEEEGREGGKESVCQRECVRARVCVCMWKPCTWRCQRQRNAGKVSKSDNFLPWTESGLCMILICLCSYVITAWNGMEASKIINCHVVKFSFQRSVEALILFVCSKTVSLLEVQMIYCIYIIKYSSKREYSYGMNHVNVLLHKYFPYLQTKQASEMVSLWTYI
jgi:hypothetical protein